MDLWVAELYDYSYESPFIVGIYDTAQKAADAVDIIRKRHLERNPDVPDSRFVPCITQIQLNGFCPGIMDFLGVEIGEKYN